MDAAKIKPFGNHANMGNRANRESTPMDANVFAIRVHWRGFAVE
jgi:hypothetical protein